MAAAAPGVCVVGALRSLHNTLRVTPPRWAVAVGGRRRVVLPSAHLPQGGPAMGPRRALAESATETVKIEISDPTAILRALATRYESSTRIMMEYIDNSLDSAEELRQAAAAGAEISEAVGYPAPVTIHVGIDRKKRRIWVSDNCGGVDPTTLTRLASRIGESQKRGVAWLNGQFGFGLHAFRAAASTLHVYSARPDSTVHHISMNRDQISVVMPVPLDANALAKDKVVAHGLASGLLGSNDALVSSSGVSGTAVVLDDIDRVWFRSLTTSSITAEIEHHFESLLRRRNLTVTVSDAGAAEPVECMAFDYDEVDGHHIDREIAVSGGHAPVVCKLIVSSKVVEKKRPRFFKQGRCIGPVADTKSFIKQSEAGDALWGHPALSGFIEVGSVLEPVITRDEFVKTTAREELYKALAPIEKELGEALSQQMERRKDESLGQLEDVLVDSITKVVRNDAAFFRSLEKAQKEKETSRQDKAEPRVIVKDNVEYKTVKERKPGAEKGVRAKAKPLIDVRFVSAPPEGDDETPVRSFESGSILYVNIAHPDFIERQHRDHKGQLRYNSRIAAYLAAEVACHYRKAFYERHKRTVPSERRRLYEELMDSVHAMESVLTAKIATLERKMRVTDRWGKGEGRKT